MTDVLHEFQQDSNGMVKPAADKVILTKEEAQQFVRAMHTFTGAAVLDAVMNNVPEFDKQVTPKSC